MKTSGTENAAQQSLDLLKLKAVEHQLDDVMEIIDKNNLKKKLVEVEADYCKNPGEINTVRLGIIYHETALNLTFFSKTEFKGYAKKSFDRLTEVFYSTLTEKELLPFITSYRASALSLVGAETKKLALVGQAFTLFDRAVRDYAAVSYLPQFLRGSVAENLPWIFFSKRKFARLDFQSIVTQFEKNSGYANWKVMSFTYLGLAKQMQHKKLRQQALAYLHKAIALDPHYKAGREKAEELQHALMQ